MSKNDTESGKPEQLDPAIVLAAELHAQGVRLAEIARRHECSPRQVRRWLQKPEARKIIADIRSASMSEVSGHLQHHLTYCMERLLVWVAHSDPKISLSALKQFADNTLRIKAHEEYEARLHRIEESLKMSRPGSLPLLGDDS